MLSGTLHWPEPHSLPRSRPVTASLPYPGTSLRIQAPLITPGRFRVSRPSGREQSQQRWDCGCVRRLTRKQALFQILSLPWRWKRQWFPVSRLFNMVHIRNPLCSSWAITTSIDKATHRVVCSRYLACSLGVTGTMLSFVYLEKKKAKLFQMVFINPFQSSPSSAILVPFCFRITPLVFFFLSKPSFLGFPTLEPWKKWLKISWRNSFKLASPSLCILLLAVFRTAPRLTEHLKPKILIHQTKETKTFGGCG